MQATNPSIAHNSSVTQNVLPKVDLQKDLGAKKCIVFAHVVNGYGDISCGFRLAANLMDRVGIPKDNIVIATNHPGAPQLFNERKFRVIDYTELKTIQDVALQIIAPASLGFIQGDKIISRTPTLQLWEYGYENESPEMMSSRDAPVITKSMGLNADKGEIGIWIDPQLYSWGFSEESQDPSSRIRLLKDLNPSLRKCILGEGDFQTQADSFVKSSRLYMGYTAKDDLIPAYLYALAQMNAQDSRDLTVIVPGYRRLENIDSENLQRILAGLNVGTFTLKSYPKDKGLVTQQEHKLGDSPKKLTLICGAVPSEDMRLLWMASEKEVLATGDQSLSEAVSANKSIVYEEIDHKINLGLRLQQIYNQRIQTIHPSYRPDPISVGHRMHQLFTLNRSDNYNKLTQINRSICEQQDCLPNVAKLMKQAMEFDLSTLERVIDYRQDPSSFVPASIPFDVNCYVSLDQVSSLAISMDSGRSALSELRDSRFEFKWVGPSCYGIKRKKAS